MYRGKMKKDLNMNRGIIKKQGNMLVGGSKIDGGGLTKNFFDILLS